jgi:hypothetical protein
LYLQWTIQQNIPAGEYLVRVEHIGLHEGHVGKAQLYMECFQLNIASSGKGNLSPTVKIPGVYSAQDPGIAFNKWYVLTVQDACETCTDCILGTTPSLTPCPARRFGTDSK